MFLIHQGSFYLHIAVGSCALLLFWIPVFTKKGNLDHQRFGRYFSWAMYIVAFSGFTMSSLDLINPLVTHAVADTVSPEVAADFVTEARSFALFLLSLSILVLTNTRQGWLSIKQFIGRRLDRRKHGVKGPHCCARHNTLNVSMNQTRRLLL